MAEIIRLAARRPPAIPGEKSVVVVQGVRAREARSLARDLQQLAGGEVIVNDFHPTEIEQPSSENGECSSCSLREALEEQLLNGSGARPEEKALLWLVTPVDADPWAVVDAFAKGHALHERGFRIRSWVTSIQADSLLEDWTSIRRVGRARAVPLVEAIADQIDFSDVMVIDGAGTARSDAIPFLRRLNHRAELLARDELSSHWARGLHERNFDAETTANGARWRHSLQSLSGSVVGQVYRRHRPFHPERLFELVRRWPEELLRSEGIAWIASEDDVAFTITQAGPKLFDCSGDGYWLATLSAEDLALARVEHAEAFLNWNPETGDRMTELAFAWDSLSDTLPRAEAFFRELDRCLLSDFEMRLDWTRFRDPFREEREKDHARSEKRRARKTHSKPLQAVGHHPGGTHGNTQEKDLEKSP